MTTDPRLLAQNKSRRDALRALTAEIGGNAPRASSAERVGGWVATLIAGKIEKNGKMKVLSVAETARLILKVCKVDPARVPAEARSRFPWGAVSRETLAALAASERVDAGVFLTGLGLAQNGASAASAPVASTVAPIAAPEAPAPPAEGAPEAPAPPAPVPFRRTVGGRR